MGFMICPLAQTHRLALGRETDLKLLQVTRPCLGLRLGNILVHGSKHILEALHWLVPARTRKRGKIQRLNKNGKDGMHSTVHQDFQL
jgi:hypothetical protein